MIARGRFLPLCPTSEVSWWPLVGQYITAVFLNQSVFLPSAVGSRKRNSDDCHWSADWWWWSRWIFLGLIQQGYEVWRKYFCNVWKESRTLFFHSNSRQGWSSRSQSILPWQTWSSALEDFTTNYRTMANDIIDMINWSWVIETMEWDLWSFLDAQAQLKWPFSKTGQNCIEKGSCMHALSAGPFKCVVQHLEAKWT